MHYVNPKYYTYYHTKRYINGIPFVFLWLNLAKKNYTLYDIYLSTALNANFEH